MEVDIDKAIRDYQRSQENTAVPQAQADIDERQAKFEAAGYRESVCPEAHRELAEFTLQAQSGDPRGLCCLGTCGTGKTEFMRRFITVNKRLDASEIVEWYKKLGWNEDFEEVVFGQAQIGDVWCPPQSVYIDDLGQEPVANRYGERRELLEQVVAERYKQWQTNGVRTYITSNLTGAQLDQRYGRRLTDRLREMCRIVYFNGESARGQTE